MPTNHLPERLKNHPLIKPGYRTNVSAVVLDEQDRILWCERADVPGSWQFPQGGVTPDEDPLSALYRELTEELGVSSPHHHFSLETRAPEPILYRYPISLLDSWIAAERATWLGQEQHYFQLRFSGDDALFTLEPPPGMRQEFSNFTWSGPERLNSVVDFKRPALERALKVFGLL